MNGKCREYAPRLDRVYTRPLSRKFTSIPETCGAQITKYRGKISRGVYVYSRCSTSSVSRDNNVTDTATTRL